MYSSHLHILTIFFLMSVSVYNLVLENPSRNIVIQNPKTLTI